jgi:D-beta-D-heptose 7-phosphate kinase/D-beta-D-heptose 1-phosphate adenosyltransferase
MIYVVGDSFLDEYWYGSSYRLSPEAPVPVVLNPDKKYAAGGAANVANNLESLGSDVTLITNIGNDVEGLRFKSLVSHKTDVRPCSMTPHKIRVYANDQCVCRVDNEVTTDAIRVNFLSDADYIILSDYNKGAISDPRYWIESNPSAKVCVDPKKDVSFYEGAWLVKPNLKEFYEHFGKGEVEYVARWAIKKYNIENILVTMGKDGMMWVTLDKTYRVETKDVPVHDVTGAGDVVMAAIVYAIERGMDITQAMNFANQCASVAIQQPGTYIVKPSDVLKRIIFTNGCFDIIHPGHIDLLKKAKELGDYLIVGLNSDDSVRRLKGSGRPINDQASRKLSLEAIKYVDEVIIFDDDTPIDLIKRIKPNVIVKGGDYTPEQVVGNEVAEVVIVPTVYGFSTSNIIQNIKEVI